jgi:uncharacterized protein (TIGR01244 family)
MALEIIQHNPDFATVGQIQPEEVREIAALGFKSIIDNRPDFESGPSQPVHTDIEKQVIEHGLQFAFLPVVSGQITLEQVHQMAQLIESLPKPILAFCRSGARSTNLFQLASQL